MNYTFLIGLTCVMAVLAPIALIAANREARARRRRRAEQQCHCDLATCSRSVICRLLGEYRITYRVIESIANEPEYGITTIEALLAHIACECEILVK